MAIPKVCGIETEYGILSRGLEQNPVSASSLLITAYANTTRQQTGWDFHHESPARDARHPEIDGQLVPDVETSLVNTVLPNGARYYVDHAHPEMSMPEVRTAREAVQWDRAADEILRASMRYAAGYLDGGELIVHKNNSDGKGNSYGCHENYLVDRRVPFQRIADGITPHFVTRQLFCGAGKVCTEQEHREPDEVPFQLSQRADFFEAPIGLETTLKRPIVNTRDEPHCDSEKYRRLHVIVGDANMSDTATFLKIGTTAILLAMIEDGELGDEVMIADPVRALREVSHDPTLTATVQLVDGGRATALDIQWHLLERAAEYAEQRGLDAVDADVGAEVLGAWELVLEQLAADPGTAAETVDWVAKQRLVEGHADRHGLPPGHPRLKAIDLQYHDLRPERCLADRVGLRRIVTDAEVAYAMAQPPTSTRAYFRGRCVQKFGPAVVAANWDSLVFDTGGEHLQRIPMSEPLRGTADHVARLIDTSTTAVELVERLRT